MAGSPEEWLEEKLRPLVDQELSMRGEAMSQDPDTKPFTTPGENELFPDQIPPPMQFMQRIPSFTAAQVFIKAQSQFIRAQSYFLEEGRNTADNVAYIEHLTAYSQAQLTFLKAQADYMNACGVI